VFGRANLSRNLYALLGSTDVCNVSSDETIVACPESKKNLVLSAKKLLDALEYVVSLNALILDKLKLAVSIEEVVGVWWTDPQ
jgi:uncharacterized protein YbaR (Trm112 family)